MLVIYPEYLVSMSNKQVAASMQPYLQNSNIKPRKETGKKGKRKKKTTTNYLGQGYRLQVCMTANSFCLSIV